MTLKVITVGADEALVKSRALVLQARNYEATWGLEKDARELLQRGPYNLLLVCSSSSVKKASELIAQAKQQDPNMCIVRLISPGASTEVDAELADEVVFQPSHPLDWVSAVDRLLRPVGQVNASVQGQAPTLTNCG